ncbi:MAG: FAD-binding protein [Paludibacteraceae bacterium]|nr:FAD-binding protein [Paludibacteraceae bacterium]
MAAILTDSLHKIAYATDASVYREVPFGVSYPESEEDIRLLIAEARKRGTNIIARAGGTSIAGQVVGNGIVADISRHLNHIIEINPDARYAWVEPGVVRDELNIACKPHGLFFSPETSTSNRCCIGGMFGNNSCGTHSLVYGSTRRHVLEADGILADGSSEHFASYTVAELERRFGKAFWLADGLPLIGRIYAQLIHFALDEPTRTLIADTYPDPELTRRSCGYAIDEVIADLCDESKPFAERTVNLCQLLAGSEGTLAFITRIKVSLDPLPAKEVMVVCAHCTTLDAAFEANLIALKHKPMAVELMDGEILQLSKGNPAVERFFVTGDPEALLITELRADDLQTINRQADALEKDLLAGGLVTLCTRVYGAEVSKVWNLRKAGLGILGSMPGDAKPTGVIEDTAVAANRLPAYMRDFREMLARLGTNCVFYGHISTGELHLRPILNLKTPEGKQLFRTIARETTLLVRKHRGTISGEHGDGRLRGEFIPLQYGEPTYELMRQLKYCWDKDGLFNPHKIVDTPHMDESLRADRSIIGDELVCSVEKCNGAGDCRKSNLIGGTMCPSYKVSRDELHTTRARANILREWFLSPYNDGDKTSITDVKEVLSSCLACKACKRECPSGVDMTRLRAEVLQQIYDREGTPLHTWLVAHSAGIQRLGACMPHIYNFFATNRYTSSLLKRLAGFALERSIPTINSLLSTKKLLSTLNTKLSTKKVYLFLDEFTLYQEPQLIETFILLLSRLGYEVLIPKHVESGRAAVSKGCLRLAKRYAEKNVRLLRGLITEDAPLVGIEPSAILTFRDEYPELVPPKYKEDAERLAQNSLLYDEFLMREVRAGRITAEQFSDLKADIWLHGHCHQKALVGVEQTAALLDLPKNTTVHIIPSGCCGMAGSFGYEHYQTSIAIGEMVLFPAIRQAVSTQQSVSVIAAPGISCRTQIKDGTGITAHHPIEILYRLLRNE